MGATTFRPSSVIEYSTRGGRSANTALPRVSSGPYGVPDRGFVPGEDEAAGREVWDIGVEVGDV